MRTAQRAASGILNVGGMSMSVFPHPMETPGASAPAARPLVEAVQEVRGRGQTPTVYLAHNHPSGNPKPSAQDIETYAGLGDMVNGLGAGMVGLITDGEQFSVYESTDTSVDREHPYRDIPPGSPPEAYVTLRDYTPLRDNYQGPAFLLKGGGPEMVSTAAVADLLRRVTVDPGSVVIILHDTGGMVQGVVTMPAAPSPEALRALLDQHAGSGAILVMEAGEEARGDILGMGQSHSAHRLGKGYGGAATGVVLVDKNGHSRVGWNGIPGEWRSRQGEEAVQSWMEGQGLLNEAQAANNNANSESVTVARENPAKHKVDVSIPLAARAKRQLFTKGNLPSTAFDLDVGRKGQIAAREHQVKAALESFRVAAKEAYGSDRLTDEQLGALNEVLAGRAEVGTIPEGMRRPVTGMRKMVDALSRDLIRSGVIEGDMLETVQNNMGFYLTRSYRVFDDPTWSKKVPEETVRRAHSFLAAEFPEKSDAEINGMIKHLLHDGKAADSPMALIAQSQLGAKDLSILTRRKDIAPEIRELFGEHIDPRINFARSVAKMSFLVANHRFLEEALAAGLEGGWIRKPEDGATPTNFVQIAPEGSDVMNPLSGHYTSPEIAQAFEDATAKEEVPDWLRMYLKLNGAVKVGKTVLSVTTAQRNVLSNIGFALTAGHFEFWHAKKAWAATWNQILRKPKEKHLEYVTHLIELGVLDEGARTGELMEMIREASQSDMASQFLESRAMRMAKSPYRVAMRYYRAGDMFWKVYGFENEKTLQRRMNPKASKAEIERLAAKTVRSSYPTYSMVPRLGKHLRRFPAFGTFISFPAEVMRITGTTTVRIKSELSSSNPEARRVGARRLVGAGLAASIPSALAWYSRYLFGIDWEDEKDMREFMASWNQNGELYWSKAGDGWLGFVDLSYVDPFKYVKTPIMALLANHSIEDAVRETVTESIKPFLGEEILFGKIKEAYAIGTDAKEQPFWTRGLPFDERAQEVLSTLWEAFEPGTIRSLDRTWKGIRGYESPGGVTYDPTREMVAMFTGQRLTEFNLEQAVGYRSKDFSREWGDATRLITGTLGRRGTVTDAEIRKALENGEHARREAWDGMQRRHRAAMRLGLSDMLLEDIYREAGLSSKLALDVTFDDYLPWEMSGSTEKRWEDKLGFEEWDRRRGLLEEWAGEQR